MNAYKKDDDWLKPIKEQLDSSCDELSIATVDALRQARTNSLNKQHSQSFFSIRTKALGGVSSFAMMAFLSWFIFFSPAEKKPAQPMASVLEDMPIILANQDLDFYENLDFHLWLATEVSDDLG